MLLFVAIEQYSFGFIWVEKRYRSLQDVAHRSLYDELNIPNPMSSAIMHRPELAMANATPYFWKSNNCELTFGSIA